MTMWLPDLSASSRPAYLAIADAIAKGDGDAAAKAVRTHIESLRSRLMRAQDAAHGRGSLPRMT